MNSELQPKLTAGGAIAPFRMVKLSAAANYTGLVAGANAAPVGITSGSTRLPIADASSPNHCESGDPIELQQGHILKVQYGGTIAAADNVIADAAGKAVTAAVTGTVVQNILGKALVAGVDGDLGYIFYQPLAIRPALT